MARILSLETSVDVCSVAIHNQGTLIKEIVINEAQAHAARLAPLIQEILKQTALTSSDLQAVAITSGPGSYTGLRIGTSTAKGLCYALDIPLISIPTLDILAYQAKHLADKNTLLCPMIDARRMEVYCQITDTGMNVIQPVEALVINEKSFEELLAGQKMLFFGNGAEKCRTVLNSSNAVFLNGIFPRAAVLGSLAHKKFEAGEYEELADFKPAYLKDFVAKKAQPLLD
jgi:tRNA threonylcarbamoyladenosine biosynthesis protein TsaB